LKVIHGDFVYGGFLLFEESTKELKAW